MQPITIEWVYKAEGDFATAEREIQVKDNPNYDGICFHCQQCAEKYLKARWQEANIPFSKIHDLSALLDLTLAVEPNWNILRGDLQLLSAFAVTYRYPGDTADKDDAQECVMRCRHFRQLARQSLGL
jgi:HEPN domain-containing protein